jgi:site-specific DNA recombinase
MKVALYARVSTERQAERGTIGSQLDVLRAHVSDAGDELVGEYVDDGHSGARLDRPALDAMRDAAEGGLFEQVWCLSPDRLARAYAYQVLVLDELTRFGVTVRFTDSPGLAPDDPQATLLTQVQGVIAEYEKAKIAERYRRGKLFRARAGEIITWKTAYGYRRVARSAATGPAHWEIYEPEAAVVRRIFTDRSGGTTVREICRSLNTDQVPSPTGKATWGTSTILRLLHNEAYVGRVYFNRTEAVPDRRPAHHSRQVPRDRADWITIDCPRIVTDDVFEAVGRVAVDNAKWSPRRAEPGRWLLKGLVKCGACGVGTNSHKMRGRNGTWHYYYYCRNHDPIRAGGEERRCPERNIRADALDEFVFDQIRVALLQPDLLLAGEHAVAVSTPIPDDELLGAELARLDRKIDAADAERRRLVDLYQAGLIELPELQRRAAEVAARHRDLQAKRASLAEQRTALARGNQLRRRVHDFAERIRGVIDQLDAVQKQQLLRLLIDEVRVPAGTSRSACASPSTHHRRTTAIQKVRTNAPGRRHDPGRCQAKTVCVPLVGVKAFTYRRVKNDRRDAADLADLLRMGRLPEAYVASPEEQELRELVRQPREAGGVAVGAEGAGARRAGQAGPAAADDGPVRRVRDGMAA